VGLGSILLSCASVECSTIAHFLTGVYSISSEGSVVPFLVGACPFIVIDHEILSTVFRIVPLLWHVQKIPCKSEGN
jgi:hypothetical protein